MQLEMQAKLAATQVLQGLYTAIADHTQVDQVLSAMDEFIESNPLDMEQSDTDWKSMFRQHFDSVSHFINYDIDVKRDSPIIYVDRQIVPAAVINKRLDVIASNDQFSLICPPNFLRSDEVFATPEDRRRLDLLFSAKTDEVLPALISVVLPDDVSPIFVVASRDNLLSIDGKAGPYVSLKVVKATWNPDVTPLLETAYGLTQAEVEILENLLIGKTIGDIATMRGRSVRTVRTQLSHIFSKLGLSSQTELALFLATLTQLMTKEKQPSDIGRDWLSGAKPGVESRSIRIGQRKIAYLRYGDPAGSPVLMIHSTTPPDMTPAFRQACRDAGLRVIAVHKPGSGGTDERDPSEGPEALSAEYKAILWEENISKAVIVGHCSGGLYALQMALDHPDCVRGLVLVDTGVPLKSRNEFMQLPAGLRRTFLPARYFPNVLLVPHLLFASNFKRSKDGEAAVIDYFFQDSPVDQALTRSDRYFYEITRRIIEYSFEDVKRLVADVQRWAKDWSPLLKMNDDKKILFVQGSHNTMFKTSAIQQYVDEHSNATLRVSEGNGQLQLYQEPGLFIEAVKDIWSGNISEIGE